MQCFEGRVLPIQDTSNSFFVLHLLLLPPTPCSCTERAKTTTTTTSGPTTNAPTTGPQAPTGDALAKATKAVEARACKRPCLRYYAGASASDVLVAQSRASGLQTPGVSCYPVYNKGADWEVCYQKIGKADKTNTEYAYKTAVETYYATAADQCNEILGLASGKTGGDGGNGWHAPTDGATGPTKLGGWMKGAGTLGCGWGSTYWGVSIKGGDSAAPTMQVGNAVVLLA